MVTKKTTKPKAKKSVQATVTKLSQDVQGVLKKVKTKYNNLDPETKKKIVAGVATVAALLAARAAVKNIKKR